MIFFFIEYISCGIFSIDQIIHFNIKFQIFQLKNRCEICLYLLYQALQQNFFKFDANKKKLLFFFSKKFYLNLKELKKRKEKMDEKELPKNELFFNKELSSKDVLIRNDNEQSKAECIEEGKSKMIAVTDTIKIIGRYLIKIQVNVKDASNFYLGEFIFILFFFYSNGKRSMYRRF